MLAFYNDIFDRDSVFDDVFMEPFIASPGYLMNWVLDEDDFPGRGWENDQIRSAPGKLIIESASDNSIPYEIWEMLVSRFDATRIHLG